MSSGKCGMCKENITRDKVVCYGICDRQFHIKCVGVNTAAAKAISEYENIKYVCSECCLSSNKILLSNVNKLIQGMNENEKNRNSNEEVIMNIAEAVKDVKEFCIVKEDEMKKRFESLMKSNATKGVSFADKVKDNKSEPVIFVIPKDKQSSSKTQSAIKESFNPAEHPVNGVKNISNGAVILTCKNTESVDCVKDHAIKKLGDKYNVKVSALRKPNIKISGMSEKITDDEVVHFLKTQNDGINNDEEIKILTQFENRINRNFTAVLEVNGELFTNLINRKKVSIGWDRCIVSESLNVRRCYKCNGYNHKAGVCTRDRACKKCSGGHDLKECTSNFEKCINCVSVNQRLKLNFEVNHSATSSECKVFQRQIELERKRIEYNI